VFSALKFIKTTVAGRLKDKHANEGEQADK